MTNVESGIISVVNLAASEGVSRSHLPLQPSLWEPTVRGLKQHIFGNIGAKTLDLFFVTNNGKLVQDETLLEDSQNYTFQCRVLGGKGGFGSLLRSFGSQISKNRNQDACRDLSGRRLRNVKAEKRVKELVEKQAEKDKEKHKKKEEKIEKLKSALHSKPKHNFNDPAYEAERSRIPEKVFSAVEEGLKVMASNAAFCDTVIVCQASTSKATYSDTDGESNSELPSPVPVNDSRKRRHVDPLQTEVGSISKRMKAWLGSDSSDDSDVETK